DEVPEGGRNDDPSLVVDAVLELAERHLAPRRRGGSRPLRPNRLYGRRPHGLRRLYHKLPQSPTLMPRRPKGCGISPTWAGREREDVLDAIGGSGCSAAPAGGHPRPPHP